MTALLIARVDGIPGPKGSLRGVCKASCCARTGGKVQQQEQSVTGVKFRKLVARELKRDHFQQSPHSGPVETYLTFYIERKESVNGGLLPSHQTPVPVHHGSGDVEKHARTIHDALKDAGVLADDALVWRTVAVKRWADAENPPGVRIEVTAWGES